MKMHLKKLWDVVEDRKDNNGDDVEETVENLPIIKIGYLHLKLKNGLILPTGQWYAPSSVISDAWFCMESHGIALFHGIAW